MMEERIDDITIEQIDGRGVLDSYDKINRWINYKFYKNPNVIDLSKTIIRLNDGKERFDINELCGNSDCFEKNNYENTEYEVKKTIKFSNSIIYGLYFEKTRFKGKVEFEGTVFYAGARLRGSIFEDEVFFTACNFCQYDLFYKEIKIHFNVLFDSLLFKAKVYFACINWNDCSNINFNDNEYQEDVSFNDCELVSLKTCFDDSYFYKDVIFESSYRSEKLLSEMSFNNSHFHGKLKICRMKLGKINLSNCHFYDTVNISNNSYLNTFNLNFSFSTIKGLFFIDSDLGDEKGEVVRLNKMISFSKVLIKQDGFIFIRNVNNDALCQDKEFSKCGEITFEYSNVLGTITIQDCCLDVLNLDKSTIVGQINVENVVVNKYENRGTIVRIKNEFIKKNDRVSAIEYRAKEMLYYRRELKNMLFKEFIALVGESIALKILFSLIVLVPLKLLFFAFYIYMYVPVSGIIILLSLIFPVNDWLKKAYRLVKKTWSFICVIPITESMLLCLNTISNKNGLSWCRGILFTLSTAFIFYSLFFITTNPVIWTINPCDWLVWKEYYWMEVLEFLWLPDGLSKLKVSENLGLMSYIWFMLGKIAVAYGIYQTISAFRKYGK